VPWSAVGLVAKKTMSWKWSLEVQGPAHTPWDAPGNGLAEVHRPDANEQPQEKQASGDAAAEKAD
jgi:hypothetical protein